MSNASRLVLSAIVGLSFMVASTFAISAIVANHVHDGTQQVDHRAPTDGNGCHHGSGGYHCH